MLERGISRKEVTHAVLHGMVIEHSEKGRPIPTCLIFGTTEQMPLHVVVGYDDKLKMAYIVTTYIPDTNHFEKDLITRKLELQ